MKEQKGRVSEFAIASLVLGIISFVQLFGLEKPIAALVFGILAIRRIKDNIKGRNLAIAGIVLSIIYIIVSIVFTVLYLPQMLEMIQKIV